MGKARKNGLHAGFSSRFTQRGGRAGRSGIELRSTASWRLAFSRDASFDYERNRQRCRKSAKDEIERKRASVYESHGANDAH